MIFATVGTHQDGFARMLSLLETLPEGELVVQYGHGRPPANARVAEPFMPFPRMVECFSTAERVITHAGVGSILLAIRHGHVPIAMPRLKRYGEHVDDHQVQLADRLSAHGRVRVISDAEGLAAALRAVPPRGPVASLPQTGLHLAVRDALHGR